MRPAPYDVFRDSLADAEIPLQCAVTLDHPASGSAGSCLGERLGAVLRRPFVRGGRSGSALETSVVELLNDQHRVRRLRRQAVP